MNKKQVEIVDINNEVEKIYRECIKNGACPTVLDTITLALANGFNVAELKMITAAKNQKEAIIIYDQIYSYHRDLTDDLISVCRKRDNLEELRTAIENGERNLKVLELIAVSKDPYSIRCGFESGNHYTADAMYNMGYPTFNKSYMTKVNKLPREVYIEDTFTIMN